MPRTGHDRLIAHHWLFDNDFNPRAPYGARLNPFIPAWCPKLISIHVPRTGHDRPTRAIRGAYRISIHVPRTGHDARARLEAIEAEKFQSTCPVRGTTMARAPRSSAWNDFNPRAPYGARQKSSTSSRSATNFNPRAPYGARPESGIDWSKLSEISIHVPRTGHDHTAISML